MALTDLTIQQFGLSTWTAFILIIWSLAWKGVALWKAAKLNHLKWFIVLLVIQTFGVLEILYIFVFSKFGFNHLRSRKR